MFSAYSTLLSSDYKGGKSKHILYEGVQWSCGRASGFRSRGPGFKTVVSKLRQFFSPPLCSCLSEETLRAVGPFYLVSMPEGVKDPTQGN